MLKARYEGRELNVTASTPGIAMRREFGLWDSFTQSFVVGERYDTITQAIGAARTYNRVYERQFET